MKRAVVGLLAHVDAGKTTLAEALLFATGAIRKAGRVDHGDALLDFDEIERDRGITVFSKQARISHDGVEFVLLDAPGHVDFSAEAERTLQVLDLAILVIGANDGVQGHTRTLWRLLEQYEVPTLVFANKTDLATANASSLLDQLCERLSPAFFNYARVQEPDVQEQIALTDEEALEELLEEGHISSATLRALFAGRRVFPCLFGSALKERGIAELLDALVELLPERKFGDEFAARVYKVTHEEHGVRVAWLKVTGGVLHAKETVRGTTLGGKSWSNKIDQIRLYQGMRYEVVRQVEAGDVCAVTGLLSAVPGDGVGAQEDVVRPALMPVLAYKVIPEGCDAHAVHDALRTLEDEDPLLAVTWDEELKEVRLQLMGRVQQEIVQRRLADRFGIKVSFGPGSVLYKETIAEPAMGIGHFEPLRHYAEVHVRLEPGERGSGVVGLSECSEDELARNWQRLILTHVDERVHRGVLVGAPLTDVRVVLVAGRAHAKHTEGGDFRQATYRAIRHALMGARNVLLEPWYRFLLELPAVQVGRALSDLQSMAARFDPPQIEGEVARIAGFSPVSTIRDYALSVAAYTSGEGSLSLEFDGYEPCHNAQDVIDAASYDPEADLAHTPDSVFCSHGAGYTVKWYEVASHAHVAAPSS